MKKVLFSTYTRSGQDYAERVLSIFPLAELMQDAEIETLVAAQLATMAPVDAVHFVGCEEALAPFRRIMKEGESALRERLLGVVRARKKTPDWSVLFFGFDFTLGKYIVETLDGVEIDAPQHLKEERNRTLANAFVHCGGEERAPAGVHFAKTSKSHSDRFLRVSRVFELTGHVQLAGFWLLGKIWQANPKFIVIDTSSLHSVALELGCTLLRKKRILAMPLIWSHSSYEGMQSIGAEVINNAIFLISASTSGGLAERLKNIGVTEDRVITCFTLTRPPTTTFGQALCDLSQSDHGGLETIISYSPNTCVYCAQGFQLITIEGDQFSLVPPKLDEILIEAKDLEPKTKALLSALAGRGAFRLFRRDLNNSELVRDIWVDGEAITNQPIAGKSKLLEKAMQGWMHYVSQAMTLDLTKVIASEYMGSTALANQSLSPYSTRREQITGIRPKDLINLPEEPRKASAVFLPAIDRQDELVSISRSMRSFQPDGSVSYLALFSLFGSSKDRDALTSSITFGSHGRQTFRLNSLFDIDIHVDISGGSWRLELEKLKSLIQLADNKNVDVPIEIDQRIDALEKGLATGLINNALWPSPKGTPLKLRSDFTLLDWSLEPPEVNTADLYVLFGVILNKLRNETGSRRLEQNPYQRAVLSPKNFDRFSDGVVQACILRASRGKELGYANCGLNISAHMLGLLRDAIVKGLDSDRAEAINEFLIALHIGRLTLQAEHLQLISTEIADMCVSPSHAPTRFLAESLS